MSWHEKAEVTNLSIGDIVLSYDINEEKIVEAEIIDRVEEFYSDGKETFAISTDDYSINLTIFHIIPYYHNGELIEDNSGTVEVGDELIIIDEDELTVSREKVILIEEGVTDNQVVYHPKSSNGYYFINRILLHD
jgi:hypothetical protein